jgi:hypothetical protein
MAVSQLYSDTLLLTSSLPDEHEMLWVESTMWSPSESKPSDEVETRFKACAESDRHGIWLSRTAQKSTLPLSTATIFQNKL